MTTIYETYDDEPKDCFVNLDAATYASFYHQEMDEFVDDLQFYLSKLPPKSTLLELGCGSGRLSRHLVEAGHNLTGLDISNDMLNLAQKTSPNGLFLQEDIRNFSHSKTYDAILAPYNVLNLMQEKKDIVQILDQCLKHMHPQSSLLAEIFTLNTPCPAGEKSFQFQVFQHPEGGRLVKEIVKTYYDGYINVEERYRSRPSSKIFADYSHSFTINAYSTSFWLDLFESRSLSVISCSHAYDGEDTTNQNRTLIHAKVSP